MSSIHTTLLHSLFYVKGPKQNTCKTYSKNPSSKKTTYLDLMRLLNWKRKLSILRQRFLKSHYKGYYRGSHKDLAKLWNCSERVAQETVDSFYTRNWIDKEHRYLERHGRQTNIHVSNYYQITKEGKKFRQKLLDILFEGYKKPSKNTGHKIQEVIQKIYNLGRTGPNKLGKNEPRESADSGVPAFEERKIVFVSRVFAGHILPDVASDLFFATWRPGILSGNESVTSLKDREVSTKVPDSRDSFKKGKKFRAITKLFGDFNFLPALDIAYRGTLLNLLKISIKDIKKLLTLIRRKMKKGWKLRSFWGFFNSEANKLPDKPKYANPWFKMLAKEYLDAINGKFNKVMQGIDSAIIAQGIAKCLRETNEIITAKTLERLLPYGTQKVKAAVDAVCYRMALGKGELPEDKVTEDHEKPKSREVYKQVKVNLETKEPYTEEDRLAGAPFALKREIIGHEPINEEISPEKEPKTEWKKPFNKFNSALGMVFYAVKLGNPQSINKAFYEKRGVHA